MKIVFYSASALIFDGSLTTKSLPSCADGWKSLMKKYAEHTFAVVAQKPGDFLLDAEALEIQKIPVQTLFVDSGKSAEDIAAAVLSLKPDVAVAASAWAHPFDWLPLLDAEIARILQKNGVRTVCNSAETAFSCFDKWQTNVRLRALGVDVARAVFVNHALFVCAGNRREISRNIYRDAVLSQIRALHFPVVIKDTTGLSSYGMEVANDFESAQRFLCGKRNSSDRIVEEYIQGEQFGLEIHGSAETGYRVLPPFRFSVNNYGITSPKQSVKIGPVQSEAYRWGELCELAEKIARAFDFRGISQIDLVFSRGKWFVIEINPRLSGMSRTYAASMGVSLPEFLYAAAFRPLSVPVQPALNIKFPLLSAENLSRIAEKPYVKSISQTENRAARQEREKGFCEAILSASDFSALKAALDDLASSFPELVETAFIETAQTLLRDFL